MGRPRKTPIESVNPEDSGQEAKTPSVNQAELVRLAVAAGHEKPAHGVLYIKREFGVDVDSKYYSVAKGNMRKGELAKPGKKTKAAPLVNGYLAPPTKPRAAGDPDMLLALEGVKELVSQYGVDKVKRMIDLIG